MVAQLEAGSPTFVAALGPSSTTTSAPPATSRRHGDRDVGCCRALRPRSSLPGSGYGLSIGASPSRGPCVRGRVDRVCARPVDAKVHQQLPGTEGTPSGSTQVAVPCGSPPRRYIDGTPCRSAPIRSIRRLQCPGPPGVPTVLCVDARPVRDESPVGTCLRAVGRSDWSRARRTADLGSHTRCSAGGALCALRRGGFAQSDHPRQHLPFSRHDHSSDRSSIPPSALHDTEVRSRLGPSDASSTMSPPSTSCDDPLRRRTALQRAPGVVESTTSTLADSPSPLPYRPTRTASAATTDPAAPPPRHSCASCSGGGRRAGSDVFPAVSRRRRRGRIARPGRERVAEHVVGHSVHRRASSRPARDASARCRCVFTEPSEIPRVAAVSLVEQSRK